MSLTYEPGWRDSLHLTCKAVSWLSLRKSLCSPVSRLSRGLPRKALRGGIPKVNFYSIYQLLAIFPHKNEPMAPRTNLGYPHEGPRVARAVARLTRAIARIVRAVARIVRAVARIVRAVARIGRAVARITRAVGRVNSGSSLHIKTWMYGYF